MDFHDQLIMPSKAKKIYEKLVKQAFCYKLFNSLRPGLPVGSFIERLTEEERKELDKLKSEEIKDTHRIMY